MTSLKFTLLITYSILTSSILAQNLEIARIRGEITNQTNRETLKKGSQFKKSDAIIFSKDSDRIAAFDKKNGEFYVISPKRDLNTPYYYLLQGRVKGRPGAITSSIGLINHINEKLNYLVIGDSCKIQVSPTAFPMNQDTFFYIRYVYDGEVINKRLPFKGNTLTIDKNDLFKAQFDKGEKYEVDTIISIPYQEIQDFHLGHFDQVNRRAIKFYDPSQPDFPVNKQMRSTIPIKLKFLNTILLKEEVNSLIFGIKTTNPKIKSKQLNEGIHDCLEKIYSGKIEKTNLVEWLDANFKD